MNTLTRDQARGNRGSTGLLTERCGAQRPPLQGPDVRGLFSDIAAGVLGGAVQLIDRPSHEGTASGST